jgi:phospholipid/cholesterol/gamma-HCH transport system substrate-binding protein
MWKVTQAAKVGIFLLISAVAIYLVYRATNKGGTGGGSYTVHAYLKDATGLATHSRVTIAGIPVGQIDSIVLENGKARVNVKMKGDVPLYGNATVGKKSALVLGEAVLVLTAGTEDHERLKDGDEITHVIEYTEAGDVLDEVKQIADRVKAVAEQLANSIGSQQGGQNMKDILQNLADATAAINLTIRENRSYINETLRNVAAISGRSEPEIERILENVRDITEQVRQLVAANQSGKPAGELRETVENIRNASRSLESSLNHIDTVTGRIDRGEGTIGRLSKDETLINEVQGVAEGVNDYVGGLTRLQTIVGLRTDYNFLANTLKSYVSLRLQPREDKYYEIELVNDPRGLTSYQQVDVDTTNPTMPSHYQTITTTTSDSFRFSLQFARRLGPFTGRFGVKESTGGIGLDMDLLQNRFEVITDLFGFGEEVQPRFRVSVGYEFVHRLWLLGGIDHTFESDLRDYFLGLQLRFTDDDLKTILPFAGGAVSGASSSH